MRFVTLGLTGLLLLGCAGTDTDETGKVAPTPEMQALKNDVLVCAVALVATGQITAPATDENERIEFSTDQNLFYKLTVNGGEVSQAEYALIDECVAEEKAKG